VVAGGLGQLTHMVYEGECGSKVFELKGSYEFAGDDFSTLARRPICGWLLQ